MAYGRLMVVGQKRTLLCPRGESIHTQAPQHLTSTELEENVSHFAAGPCDYHWFTVRVPGCLSKYWLAKRTAVCRCGSILGMKLLASSHGIGSSSRIHGPGEGQSLTGTAYSQLPSWGERTYHCLYSEMRYEARDTASAPRMN